VRGIPRIGRGLDAGVDDDEVVSGVSLEGLRNNGEVWGIAVNGGKACFYCCEASFWYFYSVGSVVRFIWREH
jgi:hypothetical protein